ncbi:MAG: exodeoxyribonuclease VII large subunit [Coriobacteriales bacterium]|jgi:exodeoxyribonuclease VII large subunit|nr:exodeoxyribonuclease VII large subunit [Coriobacteriales bacterium]
MAQPLSVSQALARAKESLEQIHLTLVGEVSELSDRPGYKAVYFTLTDRSAALPCLMWRNSYKGCGVELRKGMLVEASGSFSLYAAKGRMNFDVRALRPAGEGSLRIAVAQLAERLRAEGLMDPQRKRVLPRYPTRLALVTSPRGKAVHDVLRTLRRRYPLVEVLVAGVAVEGAGAVEQIARGLAAAAESDAELILLVRGGGSYEDLMPFNDERLARAVAASPVPVVTGIGHEPDNSIADMVADFRASTPTAAAEHAVPDIAELGVALARTTASFARSLGLALQRAEAAYGNLRRRPLFADPFFLVRPFMMQAEGASARLVQSLPLRLRQDAQPVRATAAHLALLGSNLLAPHRAALALDAARLEDLSPPAVLARGYSLAYDREGRIIGSVDTVDWGQRFDLRLADGTLGCTVEGKRREALPCTDPPCMDIEDREGHHA